MDETVPARSSSYRIAWARAILVILCHWSEALTLPFQTNVLSPSIPFPVLFFLRQISFMESFLTRPRLSAGLPVLVISDEHILVRNERSAFHVTVRYVIYPTP